MNIADPSSMQNDVSYMDFVMARAHHGVSMTQ